jgi:hypothetical protein
MWNEDCMVCQAISSWGGDVNPFLLVSLVYPQDAVSWTWPALGPPQDVHGNYKHIIFVNAPVARITAEPERMVYSLRGRVLDSGVAGEGIVYMYVYLHVSLISALHTLWLSLLRYPALEECFLPTVAKRSAHRILSLV